MENIGVVEKIKGFLLAPTESFKKFREESLGESLKYFIILLFIQSALNAIMFSFVWGTFWVSIASKYSYFPGFEIINGMGFGIITILLFVIFLIFGFIGIFISGAIVHMGVLLFGGERGYKETVKAIIYGGTPGYIFGWIPGISVIFWIWALILEILGIKELQDLSIGKAIAAILVPIIIIIGVIVAIIIIFAFAYITSMTAGTDSNTILLLINNI